jgi:site-specific recombinase XerD
MTALAPLLEAFFLDRLLRQQRASPNTIASYRDTFRLLLAFAEKRLLKAPSALLLSDIDAPFVGSFLDYLESQRNNSVRTRNARLAAIHSFFRFIAIGEPAHSALIQRVLAIPHKRFDRNLVCFLARTEIDALLEAPDRNSWIGCRDHALLLTMIQTGLRVSELIHLKREDVCLERGAHIRCRGKGRKERSTPLSSQTVAVLRTWFKQNAATSSEPLFPSRRDGVLSRDAVERLVKKHAATACKKCPTLINKNVSPHVLRHTAAVQLLEAGVDRSVIALWLGHESVETTQIYLDADLAIKERALDKTALPNTKPGRFRPPDQLLAFLETL